MSGLTKEQDKTETALWATWMADYVNKHKRGPESVHGWMACAESQADRLDTADKYIATLEILRRGAKLQKHVDAVEIAKAAYLKARDTK